MAYKALYRTYRPQTFDEVVGQKAIVQTLKNALAENKIAHAYLFCGPRGTGKTSMARLFAKALNCSSGLGEQCNNCDNCKQITSGSHPDVYEIDAASNSSVDNIRKIIEEISFAPIMGRYKVYIIDEVHAMSGSAFNALLKTLEEPPSNVVFILATTEPNKVLPTIMSRVQRFDFSKVSQDDLVGLMSRILDKENVSYDEKALQVIARISDGGVRDSLSNLDQAISYSKDNITLDDVYDLFGLFRIDEELELVRMIHNNDVESCLLFARNRYQKGGDILKLHADLINIYKDLLIYGTTRDASLMTYLNSNEAINMIVSPSEIRYNLKTLIKTYRDYKTSINSYDNFELSLLDLLSFNNQDINIQNVPNNIVENKPSPKISNQQQSISSIQPQDVVNKVEEKIEAKKEEKEENLISKIEVTPSKEVTKPSVNQEKIVTSSMIMSNIDNSAQEGGIFVDKDTIINIMVQGSKALKLDIQSKWKEKLSTVSLVDEMSALSTKLSDTEVCLVANGVVVVKSYFDGIIKKVNSSKGQSLGIKLLDKLFDFKGKLIAITNSDYIDYVNYYKQLAQANNIPSPKPIEIKSILLQPKQEEQSNASKFLDSLK